MATWRTADFVAQQRQALTSQSSGVLTDLAKKGNSDYTKRIESLARIPGSARLRTRLPAAQGA